MLGPYQKLEKWIMWKKIENIKKITWASNRKICTTVLKFNYELGDGGGGINQ